MRLESEALAERLEQATAGLRATFAGIQQGRPRASQRMNVPVRELAAQLVAKTIGGPVNPGTNSGRVASSLMNKPMNKDS
jgi:hypothetical protein